MAHSRVSIALPGQWCRKTAGKKGAEGKETSTRETQRIDISRTNSVRAIQSVVKVWGALWSMKYRIKGPHPRNRRTCHSFVLDPVPLPTPRKGASLQWDCFAPCVLSLSLSRFTWSLFLSSRTPLVTSFVSPENRQAYPIAVLIGSNVRDASLPFHRQHKGRFFVKKITRSGDPKISRSNVTWPAIIISRTRREFRLGLARPHDRSNKSCTGLLVSWQQNRSVLD